MREEYGYDRIVTVTVDVGQPKEDILQATEKAAQMKTEHYTVDAKEEFVPELDLGLDFSHKLTERQNIFASIDYYPSLSDFPQYRALGKAGWEIVVDPEVNMYLKIGVSDRYISNPGTGFKKNDLEYFLTLGWEF